METISILGCGWLGSPLALTLLAEGYTVKGSTTRAEKLSVLRDVGIRPYRLSLNPELQPKEAEDFFQSDLLIIDIPPKTRDKGPDFHPQQIEAVAEEIKAQKVKHCIYISSTSVYPNLNREVSEEDAVAVEKAGKKKGGPTKGSMYALLQAEETLKAIPDLALTIIRCGGLMGYDRIPGRYFAGKQQLTTGSIPVNYIHRDDVIGIILEVIRQGYWKKTLNAVAPQHPSRQQVYEQNAEEFGFNAPTFKETPAEEYKIVSPGKLLKELQYTFRYPNPLEFRFSKT